MITQFEFTGVSKVTMTHQQGDPTSKHVATDFMLVPGENLNSNMYLDKDGRPDKGGVKPLTQCFIQGLVGNILLAHERGWWDSAEHLRYIIAQLEEGFVRVADIKPGEM